MAIPSFYEQTSRPRKTRKSQRKKETEHIRQIERQLQTLTQQLQTLQQQINCLAPKDQLERPPPPPQEEEKMKQQPSDSSEFTLSDYLYDEIFGLHYTQINRHSTAEKNTGMDGMQRQERVANFLQVPLQLEKLLGYGFFISLDCFLYVFTYLPIRIAIALFCALSSAIFHKRTFHRAHSYDIMRGIMIAVASAFLCTIDMSRIYHAIRGQDMIKLYVLFTMIEIFDRLFCSLGQDILDSLYFTVRYQPRRVTRLTLDFTLALAYLIFHSLLLFSQVITINVAINSSNASLLTLLISNNFAELKTSVFKRFEEQNLFQISCSDIVERFKLVLNLSLILLISKTEDALYGSATVLLAEVIIDSLKHAFITKFNKISPNVYSKYLTIFCRDIAGCRNEQDNSILDHTHHVSRRLGLVSLPLACIVIRMFWKIMLEDDNTNFTLFRGIAGMLLFMCLVAIKVLTSILLLSHACASGRLGDNDEKTGKLERIERFTLWKGRIV